MGEDPEVDKRNERGKRSLVAKGEGINELTMSTKARSWTAMDEKSIDNPQELKEELERNGLEFGEHPSASVHHLQQWLEWEQG